LQINEAAAAVRADKIKIKNTQDAARAAETTVNGARTAFRSSTQRGSSFAGSAKTLNTQLIAAKSLLSFDASKIKIDNNMINITSGSLRNAKAQLGSALAAKTSALKTKNSGLITSTTKAVIDVNTQISRLTSQITAGSSRVAINTLKMGSNNLTKLKIESSLKEINTAIEGLIRAIDSDRIKLDNAEKAFTAAMNAVDAAQAQLSADIERGSSLTNRKGSINAEISQGSLRVTE
jgi:predicted  nucleic acid-binding Zn-ribbon protein